MQFKNPELLYALFLLLIPIIVHLFQLRKFKKQAFTNVAFLKKIKLQTRKSSQIKKWLTLLVRLGIYTAIILAFAQPYISKNNNFNTKTETVIYLDNSFSMQTKGDSGPLLKRAIQDLINNVPEEETVSILTNNTVFKNTTIKSVTNELLQLDYSTNQLPYSAALLKSKKHFSKAPNTIKNLIFISDFQQKTTPFKIGSDSLIRVKPVQLKPVNTNNTIVDSVFVSKRTSSNLELSVTLKNNGNPIENLPVSLFNNDVLLTKTAVSITQEDSVVFSLPANEIINGKILINDANLQFDNTLFFNVNSPSKINVLAIHEANNSFLNRIYTPDEFNYIEIKSNQLNYNSINDQNLIILNELKQIPNSLTTALKSFTNANGIVVVIPSKDIDLQTYNSFLLNNNLPSYNALSKVEKHITSINYSHPLYSDGVFEKQVSNFQYPKVNSYYPQELGNASGVLQYEDTTPFLSENNRVFVFSAALNKSNSNFTEINLIVPTLYNIAKQSLQLSKLFYTIGKDNTYDIATELKQNEILNLVNTEESCIPQQQYFNNKVTINTNELPTKAGIYSIKNKETTIENVSYNFDRTESNLYYQELSNTENITVNSSISNLFDTLKNDSKINALWKWFVIFALVLLIIEMLILKYFK